jgi:hypothetical protein
MKKSLYSAVIAVVLIAVSLTTAHAKTLTFGGHVWTVKSGTKLAPGPNDWDANNVWVDDQGALHLKITHRGGRWQCAQIVSKDRLGFGRYQFWVVGRIDKFDPNVVLGMFSYPPRDVGPDRTNEIDIEIAKWGRAAAMLGNYTVWPVDQTLGSSHSRFPINLSGSYTTQRFIWSSASIEFQSLGGNRDDNANQFAHWLFAPPDPANRISHQPMPFEINLWLFKGQPPTDGQEVEVILRGFTFSPAP